MMRKKIVIAGGGLTGLSVAWHLQERDRHYLLFEKEREVGGLCCSRRIGGFIFDRGGHVLHFKDRRTLSLVKEFLGSNLKRHERVASFYAFGRFGEYPFQAHFRSMPSRVVRECLDGVRAALADSRKRRDDAVDFPSWIVQRFGRGIARHFLFPYNEKFWRVPLTELSSEWAKRVIPAPPLGDILSGARGRNSGRWGYNATFWYPRKGGIQELPLAMASGLKNVVTGCAIRSIDAGKREVVVGTGAREKFDSLVTTIPLPDLFRLLINVPRAVRKAFVSLRWNSILNINLGVQGDLAFDSHWIYFPHKSVSFFRAGLPHRISRSVAPRGQSALSLEIAYRPSQAPDMNCLIDRAIRDSRSVGLIGKDQRVTFSDAHDITHGYPVYDHRYARARETIAHFLGRHQIIPAGRYGAWRYMSMEDALWEGRGLADTL